MSDTTELTEFERKQIISALEHVLSTDKFVAAPQMSAFLRYVVEQSVAGNKSRIKAFTVAVDALGKPETFDPQNDPVVRVLAGRLRSSLKAYYDTHTQTNVIIQMKPGSYVPVFVNQQKNHDTGNLKNDPGPVSPPSDSAATIDTDDLSSAVTTPNTASETQALHADKEYKAVRASFLFDQQHADIAHSAGINESGVAASTHSSLFGRLFSRALQAPKGAIAIGALAVVLLTTYLNHDEEPDIEAATPLNMMHQVQSSNRARPDHLSIFVSAMDEGNVLENQLNSMMSGVFSESEHVRVYRILESNSNATYWPEDYVLSLEVLPLPNETRVGIQLMAAQTGRISHTDTLKLGSTATQRLTLKELEQITDFSRNLVSERGPLVTDYQLIEKSATSSLK